MNRIPGRQLAKELIIRFFTSSLIRTLINTILPIVISIYSFKYDENVKLLWFFPIFGMIIFILIYNILAELFLSKEKEEFKYMDLISECYRSQMIINKASATKIYRLNKLIQKHLKNKKPIDKVVFDKVADFNTIAFDICNSLYNIIETNYGLDVKCEVTVCKAVENGIVMVAFANQNESPPVSYNRIYKRTKNKYLFGQIFNDLNANIHICPDKESVQKDFHFIDGSEMREEQICQYIGIPFMTARKKIELLLQIDVSKPEVFGKTEEEILKVAENIFYPYVVLLNKAYERDLIFNGYYDIIVNNLSLESE